MSKLVVVLSGEVERRLRFEVVKKGDLRRGIEVAVVDWLGKKPRDRP